MAVTVLAELIVTVQARLVPLHAPLHPTQVTPIGTVAVKVTMVPGE